MILRRLLALIIGLGVAAAIVGLRSRDPEVRVLDASARANAPGRFVALSDGMTHYRLDGPDSGTRVMLVHGFSVPSYIWDSTAIALAAAGYRVARYDSYGRGFSDRPDLAYDMALYERQLGQMLDSLNWRDPVHLMGLSFGGAVTAGFTARHAGRVRSLTLVDPVAGTLTPMPWFVRLPIIGPMLWQAMVVPTMAPSQLTDFVEPSRWPDWVDRYREQVQYRGFGRSLLRTRTTNSGAVLDTIYAGAGRARIPTLMLWGKEDSTVSVALAPSIQQAIPHVQFHVIERAGHLPHMERTDVVNPLLHSFLRSVDEPAADTTRR